MPWSSVLDTVVTPPPVGQVDRFAAQPALPQCVDLRPHGIDLHLVLGAQLAEFGVDLSMNFANLFADDLDSTFDLLPHPCPKFIDVRGAWLRLRRRPRRFSRLLAQTLPPQERIFAWEHGTALLLLKSTLALAVLEPLQSLVAANCGRVHCHWLPINLVISSLRMLRAQGKPRRIAGLLSASQASSRKTVSSDCAASTWIRVIATSSATLLSSRLMRERSRACCRD